MRFKIDENLPTEAKDVLVLAGHDTMTIFDQHMVGEPDPGIAAICRSEGRVLVTLDLDFADIRAYPPGHYHGIIVLRPRNQAKPTVLGMLTQLLPVLDSEPLAGNLWIVQDTGLRIREGSTGQS